MLRAKNIWVVGGDPRQGALAALLAEDGHGVRTYALEGAAGARCEQDLTGLDRADCVILPLPAAGEDGTLNAPLAQRPHPLEEILDAMAPGQLLCAGKADPRLRALAEARGLRLRDYFAREELAVLNAVPTAEGAIQIAMEELPVTIQDARALVLGFGRLGSALVPRLRGLGARVYVAARRYDQRALAQSMGAGAQGLDGLTDWLCGYDVVFNTVPARLLGVEELAALKEGAVVIDLASRPGGVDLSAAAALGVRVVWALSLPGKVAPVSSGRYIMDTVYHIMEESEWNS
jgi:dipicolinate synthase subunit A